MPEEPVLIVPYRDGPYLVRGPVGLCDQTGVEIEAGRQVIALCRCGKSRQRPFCDGSHHLIHFRAPSGREDRGSAGAAGAIEPAGAAGAMGPKSEAPMPDELAILESDLRRLRSRLLAVSAAAPGRGASPRLADAARHMAAACAALRREPLDTDEEDEA